MIYLWTIITAVLLVICYWYVKDFLNPAFISGVVWLGVYLVLILTQDAQALSSLSFCIFAAAYAAFLLGVMVTKPNLNKVKGKIRWTGLEWDPVYRNLFFFVVYVIVFIWIAAIIASIEPGAGLWAAIRAALPNSSILSSGFSGVVQTMILVLFLVCFGMYLGNPSKNNLRCFLLSLLPLLITMLLSPRGVWFMVIIAAVVLMVLIYRPNNKKIFIFAVLGFVSILAIFIISSLSKFADAMEGWDIGRKLDTFLTSYFTGPSLAFISWIDSSPTPALGKYIFRFFFAVINALGFDVEVVPTLQEFVMVNGTATNVFTALYWYTIDFGVLAASVIEFGLGVLYGFLYKQARTKKIPSLCNIAIYSLMVYPIVNQFFDDVLFSRLSLWIQRLLWLFLFTKIFRQGDPLGTILLKWIKPIYDFILRVFRKIKNFFIALWRKYLCKNQTQSE